MQDSKSVIEAVEEIISPVYLVGGSVRDIILERIPKDYDFTTPLSPDEVEIKVKAAGRRAYLIGKKFGTIGFKVPDRSGKYQYVEVTTFRNETYQAGSRKPEVKFVADLKSDLARRDFTINAIALKDGEYFDPFGGRIDILAKKIKAVGVAKNRFSEDPLRMLRAARFTAQLDDFEIDPNLIGIMRRMSPSILGISRERWVQELDKLLVSNSFRMGFYVLQQSYLLKYILPEFWLHSKSPQFLQESLNEVELCEPDADIRWGALLNDIGKVFVANYEDRMDDYASGFRGHELLGKEISKGICARLKFSNDRTEQVLSYVKKST